MSATDSIDTGYDSRIERIAYLFQDTAVNGARACRIELLNSFPGFGRVTRHEGERGSLLQHLEDSPVLAMKDALQYFLQLRHQKTHPQGAEFMPYHEIDLKLVGDVYGDMLDLGMTSFGIDLYLRSDGKDYSTVLSLPQYAHLTKEDEGKDGKPLLTYKTRVAAHSVLREIQANDMVIDQKARDAFAFCQRILIESNLSSYGILLGYRDANDQVLCGLPLQEPSHPHQRFRP